MEKDEKIFWFVNVSKYHHQTMGLLALPLLMVANLVSFKSLDINPAPHQRTLVHNFAPTVTFEITTRTGLTNQLRATQKQSWLIIEMQWYTTAVLLGNIRQQKEWRVDSIQDFTFRSSISSKLQLCQLMNNHLPPPNIWQIS